MSADGDHADTALSALLRKKRHILFHLIIEVAKDYKRYFIDLAKVIAVYKWNLKRRGEMISPLYCYPNYSGNEGDTPEFIRFMKDGSLPKNDDDRCRLALSICQKFYMGLDNGTSPDGRFLRILGGIDQPKFIAQSGDPRINLSVLKEICFYLSRHFTGSSVYFEGYREPGDWSPPEAIDGLCALIRNPNLKTISFVNSNYFSHRMYTISHEICGSIGSIQKMEFKNCGLSQGALLLLTNMVREYGAIVALNVEGNELTLSAVLDLINTPLKSLNVCGHTIEQEADFQQVLDAVERSRSLSSLTLSSGVLGAWPTRQMEVKCNQHLDANNTELLSMRFKIYDYFSQNFGMDVPLDVVRLISSFGNALVKT